MAVKLIEPGGDADFGIALWPAKVGTPAAVTDFVHGGHLRSIKYKANTLDYVIGSNMAANAGGRASGYIYITAMGNAAGSSVLSIVQANDGVQVMNVVVDTTGALQLWDSGAQKGGNGSTITTGKWYRICFAWTITSSTVNEFRLFLDGTLTLSVTNASITNITPADVEWGNTNGDLTLVFRSSDHYIDDSNALTDTGNIWVTAKRPNANGTTNGFTTQIGSGGSGYGTGHSPQVNERALNNANGWSIVAAGITTEEYNIEGKSTGDIDISTATIKDYMGWVDCKALASETGNIIVNNVQSNIAITSTETLFRKVAGSSTYPAGSGTDIGMATSNTATTVSLYECGIVVAYIPAVVTSTKIPQLQSMGVGSQ